METWGVNLDLEHKVNSLAKRFGWGAGGRRKLSMVPNRNKFRRREALKSSYVDGKIQRV